MRHLKRIALGLLVLLALQAGGATLAAGAPCCPAMAEDAAKGAAPPCRSLAAPGCCEAQTSGPVPEAAVSPLHALTVRSHDAADAAPTTLALPALCPEVGASSALRTIVLRL